MRDPNFFRFVTLGAECKAIHTWSKLPEDAQDALLRVDVVPIAKKLGASTQSHVRLSPHVALTSWLQPGGLP